MFIKLLILIFFLSGFSLIIYYFIKSNLKCPVPEIQYKYLPRTIDIDLYESKDVNKIFNAMFEKPEPWIGTTNLDYNYVKKVNEKNKNIK
jgi:hypothetical protein